MSNKRARITDFNAELAQIVQEFVAKHKLRYNLGGQMADLWFVVYSKTTTETPPTWDAYRLSPYAVVPAVSPLPKLATAIKEYMTISEEEGDDLCHDVGLEGEFHETIEKGEDYKMLFAIIDANYIDSVAPNHRRFVRCMNTGRVNITNDYTSYDSISTCCRAREDDEGALNTYGLATGDVFIRSLVAYLRFKDFDVVSFGPISSTVTLYQKFGFEYRRDCSPTAPVVPLTPALQQFYKTHGRGPRSSDIELQNFKQVLDNYDLDHHKVLNCLSDKYRRPKFQPTFVLERLFDLFVNEFNDLQSERDFNVMIKIKDIVLRYIYHKSVSTGGDKHQFVWYSPKTVLASYIPRRLGSITFGFDVHQSKSTINVPGHSKTTVLVKTTPNSAAPPTMVNEMVFFSELPLDRIKRQFMALFSPIEEKIRNATVVDALITIGMPPARPFVMTKRYDLTVWNDEGITES